MSLSAKARGPSFLGKKLTDETKKKLREARLRQKDPRLGKKHSLETKLHLSVMRKGKRNSKKTEFKKGQTPWNKGKVFSHKVKEKGYTQVHTWLAKKYGRAVCCVSPVCPEVSKTYHWAKRHGRKYERNIENFMQLCAPCHQLYDNKKIKL